jgi:methylmalonyl-CoA/ethylmalonyl-CoA epimerase
MTIDGLPGVLRIDHVGVAVPDLDAAIEFYGRVFGLMCVHTEVNEEQGVREAMLAAPGAADAAGAAGTADGAGAAGTADGAGAAGTAGAAGAAGDARLQLLAPLTPESTIAKFIDRSGPGLQQLAFTVADVEAAAAAVRERGLRVLYEKPRRGTSGSRVNFVHPKDCGGVLVELVEPSGA